MIEFVKNVEAVASVAIGVLVGRMVYRELNSLKVPAMVSDITDQELEAYFGLDDEEE